MNLIDHHSFRPESSDFDWSSLPITVNIHSMLRSIKLSLIKNHVPLKQPTVINATVFCESIKSRFDGRYFTISPTYSCHSRPPPSLPSLFLSSAESPTGYLRSNDADGNENFKKTIGLISKTTTFFARAPCFFVHFSARFCTTTTWTCLISRFTEDVKTVLGYGA